jgi:Concanavalin A-like lectin/glucanases superfamily
MFRERSRRMMIACVLIAGTLMIAATTALLVRPAQAGGGSSVRFFGTGSGDLDRIKIPLDSPGRPVDVGSEDFTVEFWMKAVAQDVVQQSCSTSTAAGDLWINGNIIIDRDVFGTPHFGDYGISLYGQSGGRLGFGIAKGSSGTSICGGTNLADGNWHHVAATRNSTSGQMRLFVDGAQVASGTGPTGNVSYQDGATGFPNDPFLVIGAEKHDAGSDYPSFSGWIDEVRVSRSVRYTAAFTRPSAPFSADADTVALYHMDEASGSEISDSSGAAGGPSHGTLQSGAQRSSDEPWGSSLPPTPNLLLTATVLPHRNYLPSAVN